MTVKVAIDGPAGAGKSTISKHVANKLGFVYIDTGAMYRAVALSAIRAGIDIKNETDKVVEALGKVELDIRHEDGVQKIFLADEDVSAAIRTPEVSIGASDIAVIPAVRLMLVDLQRGLAQKHNCVMDGRDIGTYVLPDADVKIYLTADVEDRARRRYEELLEKGSDASYDEVLKDMKYRDKNDSSREFAPLKKAEDAELIDTTGNELNESIDFLTNYISLRLSDVL